MTFIVKIGHFCYWTPRLNVGLCQHPLTNTNILSYQQFSNIIDMVISLSWCGYKILWNRSPRKSNLFDCIIFISSSIYECEGGLETDVIRRVQVTGYPGLGSPHGVQHRVSSERVSSEPDVVQGPISRVAPVIVIIVGALWLWSLQPSNIIIKSTVMASKIRMFLLGTSQKDFLHQISTSWWVLKSSCQELFKTHPGSLIWSILGWVIWI